MTSELMEVSPSTAPAEPAAERPLNLFTAALLLLFLLTLLRRAWICDDAYITFRTVDNFINGYRLTWNVTERVQVFTHPLWMFLLSFFYWITHEIYLTSLVISAAVTAVTLGILTRSLAKSAWGAGLAVLGLTVSKAFVDFSTSGLENPLSHLLIVVFFLLFWRMPSGKHKAFWLSLTASLGILNRMDTALVFLPALVYTLWEQRKVKNVLWWMAAGQIPFLVWEAFAVFYYGFPFPNTAYAKLNTGIPSGEYVQQGLLYLLNSIQFDPITLLLTAAGVGAAAVQRDKRGLLLAAGMLAYLAYVVKVGGDFMSGRFLTVPLICAAILLVRLDLRKVQPWAAAGLYALVLLVGLSEKNATLHISDYGEIDRGPVHVGSHGVLDERMLYYGGTGLLNAERFLQLPDFYWGQYGEAAKNEGKVVADNYGIGLYGFFAGPDVYVLDRLALADPLLARIPAKRMVNWRIGHMERILPERYLQSLMLQENKLEDAQLREYYDKLLLITRGSLSDPRRLVEIWKMNTGQYEHLIQRDAYQYPGMQRISAEAVSTVWANGTDCSMGIVMDDSGVEVQFPEILQAAWMQVGADHNDQYELVFLKAGEELARTRVGTAYLSEPGGLSTRVAAVPDKAVRAGYDRVRVLPLVGSDERYCLGTLIPLNP